MNPFENHFSMGWVKSNMAGWGPAFANWPLWRVDASSMMTITSENAWKIKLCEKIPPRPKDQSMIMTCLRRRVKKSARTQFYRLSLFTTSPTSGRRTWGERGRWRRARAAHSSSPTPRPSPRVADISSPMELQATLGSLTVLTGESTLSHLGNENQDGNVFQVWIGLPGDGGAPPSPGNPRPDSTLSAQASANWAIIELNYCLLRKKHPVVPEQYARVVGFGEPMDTGAL